MKTLKFTSLALLIMALVSFAGTPISYSSSNDDKHLSANDSIYSPSGYMNKEIQQARSLTDKYLANKDKSDNKTEATQREVSQKVATQAVEKPKPQLKQKQSSAAKAGNAANTITDSTRNNVSINSGTEKQYLDRAANRVYNDAGQGRVLLSEVINGQRCIYVGFTNAGTDTIQQALNRAGAGDMILVRGNSSYSSFSLPNVGVKIYGGYNESGVRDIQNNITTINGTVTISNIDKLTEINGFAINAIQANMSALTITNSSSIQITNNTFTVISAGTTADVSISSSSVVVRNNNFNSSYGMQVNGQLTKYYTVWRTPFGEIYRTAYANEPGAIAHTTGAVSNVTSINNNFNSYHTTFYSGVMANGVSNISSSNDYYSKGTMQSMRTIETYGDPIMSFNDIRTQLNTSSYSAPLNLEIAAKTSTLVNIALPTLDEYRSFQPFSNENNYKALDPNEIGSIFRTLLSNKDGLKSQGLSTGPVDSSLAIRPMLNNLRSDAIAAPIDQSTREQEIGLAQSLANILKNPTEAQKVTIDSIKALLNDINKVEEALADQSPELKKASDDLLQMVANILLAQAVPDLLNKGDVSNIKAIFSELDTQRNKIMLEYAQSTKPYYENMIKDLAKNMAMLQAKNLLNPNMSKDELSKLPPSELDKILDKIRNMKDKSFEEKYLLQQEAKYRQDYLDPNNKKLESDMKGMLKNFTGRINDVLKSSDKK